MVEEKTGIYSSIRIQRYHREGPGSDYVDESHLFVAIEEVAAVASKVASLTAEVAIPRLVATLKEMKRSARVWYAPITCAVAQVNENGELSR